MLTMDFYKVFDRDIQVKITILEILFEENDWVSTAMLSDRTELERKTILKYMSELEMKIGEFSIEASNDFKLMIKKRKGFRLYSKNVGELKKFILSMIKYTYSFRIITDFFFNNEVNVTKIATENFVSESTLRRKLKIFKDILNNYELDVIAKKNVYQLVGSEIQIRKLYFRLFWDSYEGLEWPFKTIEQAKVITVIENIVKKHNLTLTYHTKNRVSYIMAINFIRFHLGKHLKIAETPEYQKLEKINQIILKKIDIVSEINLFFYVSTEEINFLLFWLQTKESIYNIDELGSLLYDAHRVNQTSIYSAQIAFIDHFFKFFNLKMSGLSFEEREAFLRYSLATHYDKFVFKHLNSDNDYSIRFLSNLYPGLKNKIIELCRELYLSTGDPLFIQNEFLISRYEYLYSIVNPVNDYEKRVNIYLETEFTYLPKKLIEHQIHGFLSPKFNVHIYTREHMQHMPKKIDLIISTNLSSEHNQSAISEKHIPVVYLYKELSWYNMTSIYTLLEESATH